MSVMKMLRADIPYDDLDLNDPDIAKHVNSLAQEVKYNSYLYDFLEKAYDWQKKTVELTKNNTVIGTIAANRVGKSEIGCAIVTCHLTGIYPDWWQGRKYDKPVKVMAACKNSDLNKTVLQAKLFGTSNWRLKEEIGSGMIPKEFINIKSAVSNRGDGLTTINIKHISGGWSELYFRAYEQGSEAAQGVEADLVLIDEQPKDSFWSEAMTRIATTGGQAICTFTPIHGLTGLVEKMMDLKSIENSPSDKFGNKWKEEDNWALVRASWEDITHIPQETKRTLAKGYAAYEADARMFGVPIAGHGRIFPYQENLITYDPREVQIQDSWDHIIGVDIGHGHGGDPSTVILCAYDEIKEIIYVTEENVGQTDTTKQMAKLITGVNHTVPVVFPRDANRTSMSSQTTVADQLREMDINLLGKPFTNPKDAEGKKTDRKAPGLNYMNQLFAEGKLRISIDCPILLKEIEGYQYTEQGKIQDGKDHCIDACRYAVMSIIQDLGEPLNNKGWDHYEDNNEEFYWNSY